MDYYREMRRPPQEVESLFECSMQETIGCETVVHPHVHEFFEVLYCVRGSYELGVGGTHYPFGQGDMVLIDPNEVHHTRSTSEGVNRYLVVKFVPEALLYAEQPISEMKILLPYLWVGVQHRKRFERALLEQAGVDLLLKDVHRESESRAFGYEMAVRSDLCRLFLWVARTLHREQGAGGMSNLDAGALMTLQRAFAYIDLNCAQNLSMQEVAAHCGMKYSTFSRFFAKYAQKSFPEYLTEARLKRAAILLATTGESITDIAMSVGFSSTSYFIQRFRRMHSLAPGQFRRRFLSGLVVEPENEKDEESH